MRIFFSRLLNLPAHLSKTERWLALLLLVALLTVGAISIRRYLINNFVAVPAPGGTFVEGLVGQPKLLSPLSATEQNDRTILSLLYVGLTQTTADGETHPVLAESWEVGEDGRRYAFTLRADLTWHDGQPLTTSDVAETITRVLDPAVKSPYFTDWDGVSVEVIDDRQIVFHLESAAASFLASTDLPIVPLFIPITEIQKNLVGNGPYRYKEAVTDNGTVREIVLSRNKDWFAEPLIDTVVFRFFTDEQALATAYRQRRIDSALNLPDDEGRAGQRFQLATARQRILFLNTAREALNSSEKRQRLLAGEAAATNLVLVTHESLSEHAALRQRLDSWQKDGAQIEVRSLSSLDLLNALSSHDYDLLFVDVDIRADLDGYTLWHSSQRGGSGLNFAQLVDEETDKLVSEAHQATDLAARRDLAGRLESRLQTLAVYEVLEQVHLTWWVSDIIKGLPAVDAVVEPFDRFFTITDWHIKLARRSALPEEE